jgi:hypothetical protein
LPTCETRRSPRAWMTFAAVQLNIAQIFLFWTLRASSAAYQDAAPIAGSRARARMSADHATCIDGQSLRRADRRFWSWRRWLCPECSGSTDQPDMRSQEQCCRCSADAPNGGYLIERHYVRNRPDARDGPCVNAGRMVTSSPGQEPDKGQWTTVAGGRAGIAPEKALRSSPSGQRRAGHRSRWS